MNHVTVREYEAVWREDEPRPLAALRSATRIAAQLHRYHRRAHQLDGTDNGLRICVEEFLFVFGLVFESFHTYWTRNSRFRIFPVALVGNSVRNSM